VPGAETWSVDTEWGYRAGRVGKESAWEPVVLCLVGMLSGRRMHFWGRDPGLAQFLAEHADDTYVAYYAPAEMGYLIRLGLPPPRNWFCAYTAWRRLTNAPGLIEASLVAALRGLGLTHAAEREQEKKTLRERILRLDFDPQDIEVRNAILKYCFRDCDDCLAVYPRIAARIDPVAMGYWCEYLKAVARMELRGIPCDVETARLVLNYREAIADHLMVRVNETWPIFRKKTFRRRALLAYCRSRGIAWPWQRSSTTGRPYQSVDDDTMKGMDALDPFIALVRQTRKTVGALKRRLRIGIDGQTRRHYFATFPFRSITGRNQPRNFVFGGPKWMRWLIEPSSPDHVLVYVDYVAQEIGIAAALSGDPLMKEMYNSNDAHMWFAIEAGTAPPGATKETHGAIRKPYKTISLGILYGLTVYGAAMRLGISLEEARAIVEQHLGLFSTYWQWSERVVQAAYDRGSINTACGWGCKVPADSNYRTWLNWQIQASGADIMRLTVIYLDRQGVQLLAPVHDGFLLCCRRDELGDLRAAVDHACTAAVRQILGDFPLRWDFAIHERRFEDEDGEPLWRLLTEALRRICPDHARHLR
jgi:hypothetical protein